MAGKRMFTCLTFLIALGWGLRLNVKHALPTDAQIFVILNNNRVCAWTGPHDAKFRCFIDIGIVRAARLRSRTPIRGSKRPLCDFLTEIAPVDTYIRAKALRP